MKDQGEASVSTCTPGSDQEKEMTTPIHDVESATDTSQADSAEYHSVPASGDTEGVGIGIVPLEQEGASPDLTKNMNKKNCTSRMASNVLNSSQRKLLVEACYMGTAAIIGALLRMVLAQLFGEECRNPGTVGWLAAGSPLCVMADGDSSHSGGIIFADLPANMFGSFIMGMMQDGKSLGLASHSPIAWLSPSNAFQAFGALHLAIRTGFCGSLTTFSSWNSEMVILIAKDGIAKTSPSAVWKAVFGYIIGIETALGSYVFGRTVASWIHRWLNPELAKEQFAMEECQKYGIAINQSLPSFERRYLHRLNIDREEETNIKSTPDIDFLSQWRESTKEARRLENPLHKSLIEIETNALVDKKPISDTLEETARTNGWDLDSLKIWIATQSFKKGNDDCTINPAMPLSPAGICLPASEETSSWLRLPVASSLFLALLITLLIALIHLDTRTNYAVTYKTMVYAMLFAPWGALLRWRLGAMLNGKLSIEKISWLPAGTLSANVLGAIISISTIATEKVFSSGGEFWTVATLRAVRIGFSGCLSTVSTFISEVHNLRPPDHGYKYVVITLTTSSLTSMTVYSLIVHYF